MTISIQRGRQFAVGDASISLFDAKGQAGTFLQKAGEKLASQQVTVSLQGGVTLATPDDWKSFIANNAGTKAATEKFGDTFGITFQDFVNVIDDAAAADDKAYALDLTPTSNVSKTLNLNQMADDYAAGMAKGAVLDLGTPTVSATAAGVKSIGPDILATPINSGWQRDRSEQESWADFTHKGKATKTFKENTGPTPFIKLSTPKWDDAEAMALMEQFAMPLHLEVRSTPNADGTPHYQDGSEMFRDTYWDDRHGTLSSMDASARTRVRFDDDPPFPVNRTLNQAKEGRVLAGAQSEVHKFEQRWESGGMSEQAAQDMIQTGRDASGTVQEMPYKLYKLAKDKGKLPADGQLALEAKYIVLQKRRRTHLQLDTQQQVQTRRDAAQAQADQMKTAGQAVPDALTRFIAKMDTQLEFMKSAAAMLQKYGQYMPSGECFIVSADRYSVYDPAARKDVPTDIDDEVGRIGEGPLHIEAEWDTNASDPFEKAIDAIDTKLAAATTQADKDALTADKTALEGMRQTFRTDVNQTVEVLKERLLKAGLEEDPTKKSKDEHAADIAAGDRPVFWV